MANGRGLTSGEGKLCKTIFADTIPVGMVRVVERKALYGGFTPYHKINAGEESYREDYVGANVLKPPDPERAHWFVHELAHVWQHVVGMPKARMFFAGRQEARRLLRAQGKGGDLDTYAGQAALYDYDASRPGLDLLDFSLEQQCEIIADFAAWTLWDMPPQHLGSHCPVPTKAQLAAVLDQFYADPGYPAREGRANTRRAARRT